MWFSSGALPANSFRGEPHFSGRVDHNALHPPCFLQADATARFEADVVDGRRPASQAGQIGRGPRPEVSENQRDDWAWRRARATFAALRGRLSCSALNREGRRCRRDARRQPQDKASQPRSRSRPCVSRCDLGNSLRLALVILRKLDIRFEEDARMAEPTGRLRIQLMALLTSPPAQRINFRLGAYSVRGLD
jgi:hypothetical protein